MYSIITLSSTATRPLSPSFASALKHTTSALKEEEEEDEDDDEEDEEEEEEEEELFNTWFAIATSI